MTELASVGDFCPNPDCTVYGNTQANAIIRHGKTRRGRRRFLCKVCRKTLNERHGTPFYNRKTDKKDILECLALLAKGARISRISHSKGNKEDAILSFLREAARYAERVEAVLLNDHLLTVDQLQKLTQEDLITLILQQQAPIQSLNERVRALEAQLAGSDNSSKPPSGASLRKKPASLREKGKRSMGGPNGHAAETLKLSAHLDYVEVHNIEARSQCGCGLGAAEASLVERRQVWDLPPLKLIVVEHQAPTKTCPHCQRRVRAPFPEGLTQAAQYGSQLMAQAAYLSHYQLMPLARVRELSQDGYGHAPSEAVILKASERVERHISPALAQTKASLKRAEVVHRDEAGLRVAGKLHWAHVVCNKDLTYCEVNTKRSHATWERIGILPAVLTRIVDDGW